MFTADSNQWMCSFKDLNGVNMASVICYQDQHLKTHSEENWVFELVLVAFFFNLEDI